MAEKKRGETAWEEMKYSNSDSLFLDLASVSLCLYLPLCVICQSVCLCVYMFTFVLCVPSSAHPCVCTCTRKLEVNIGSSSITLPLICFETEPPIGPGA